MTGPRSATLHLLASTIVLAALLLEEPEPHVKQVANLLIAAWQVSALRGLGCERRELVLVAVLALAAPVVSLAIAPTHTPLALDIGKAVLWAAQFGVLAWLLLRHLLTTLSASMEEFAAAVAAYMFVGFGFANLFSILVMLNPQSLVFNLLAPGESQEFGHIVYFSFVTLATLGYGDVAPGDHATRLLAVIESISGLMFMAILVARLVGLHTAAQIDTAGQRGTTSPP